MNIPLHKKIRMDLLEKINSEFYQENDIIPTELELSKKYGVSRPTVRQAIQALVNEGYLERRKKRGTIVKKNKIKQEFTHVLESFDSEMNRKGISPKTNVLNFSIEHANEEVAENLNIELNEEVYKLFRLRYAGEEPVVVVTTYIPKEMFPELEEVDFTSQLLYNVFKEFGYPIKSVSRKLEVIKADETTSDLLNVKENDPMFYFHTQGFTSDKIAIEYSISKYRGDINYFVFEI